MKNESFKSDIPDFDDAACVEEQGRLERRSQFAKFPRLCFLRSV